MIQQLLISIAISAAATVIFAFRYDMWPERWRLVRYFLILMAVELAAERWILPPGALGPEIGFVAAAITVLFVVAAIVKARLLP